MTVKESFNVVVDHVWQSAVEGNVDRRTRCVEFAPDSSLEGEGFEPSPRRPDSRFSAAFVTLGRIKVDSILDHFWTPANTD
jgi:hypothetical protein